MKRIELVYLLISMFFRGKTMKEWEKKEIETLFEKFFEALNYTPDEAEVILNKFETGSLREQNCFLEFMRRVVYGYDFDWHEHYRSFISLWYHWVEYGYKETGKYPVIVPLNPDLMN